MRYFMTFYRSWDIFGGKGCVCTFTWKNTHLKSMYLFVTWKLTISENSRCLNLALLVSAVSQKKSLSQSVHSGIFKHLKCSENVNFEGKKSVDSILGILCHTDGLVDFYLFLKQCADPLLKFLDMKNQNLLVYDLQWFAKENQQSPVYR